MAKEVRKIIRSTFLEEDLVEIYQYGIETFGKIAADVFLANTSFHKWAFIQVPDPIPNANTLKHKARCTEILCWEIPCHLQDKSSRIEVLRAMHGSQSPSSFRKVRSIKP